MKSSSAIQRTPPQGDKKINSNSVYKDLFQVLNSGNQTYKFYKPKPGKSRGKKSKSTLNEKQKKVLNNLKNIRLVSKSAQNINKITIGNLLQKGVSEAYNRSKQFSDFEKSIQNSKQYRDDLENTLKKKEALSRADDTMTYQKRMQFVFRPEQY